MKIKSFIMTSLMIFVGLSLKSQIRLGNREAMIDSLFNEYVHSVSPGGGIAVVDSGKIVFKKFYGLANLEHNIPTSDKTRFHIASCTKTITAYGILLLDSQGKLSLNDDIRKYLPELPNYGYVVTIEHLLNHTSGLRGKYGIMLLTGWDWMDYLSNERFMRVFIHQNELDFKPGKYYRYTDTNYFLLARIIEKTTGMTYKEWITENVLIPAGMNNTEIRNSHSQLISNCATPYSKEGDTYEHFEFGDFTTGSVGVFTTIEDMAKWIIFFNKEKNDGSEILKKLTEPAQTNDGKYVRYGRGVIIDKNPVCYWHSGSMAGFKTFVLYIPDCDHGVVVINNGNFNSMDIALKSSAIFHPKLHPDIIEEMKENWSGSNSEAKPEMPEITKEYSITELEDFVGNYTIGRNYGFRLFIMNDTLRMGSMWSAQTKRLIPVSRNQLYVVDDENICAFYTNKNGKVDSINNIGPFGGKAVRVTEPDSIIISDFSGVYYSDELLLSVKIVFNEGRFTAILNHPGMECVGLYLSVKDYLTGDFNFFNRLEFYRDGNNKIAGFKLKGHRISSMDFKKLR